MWNTMAVVISCLWLAVIVEWGLSLKLNKMIVPPYKIRGEMAVLECEYALEGGEILYSVKWYKDNEEFYRFVPKLNPPQQSYRLDGVKVEHQMSDSIQVVLRGVNLKSSGNYKCEVSAEAPSFASVSDEARMDVVYLPKDGPHITGEERPYQIGDELSLNCTSGKSYPASTLHWYINDEKVSDPDNLQTYPLTVFTHGLVSSTLGLRIPIAPRHFFGGEMKVRCLASVSPVLWQGLRESVVQEPSPLVEHREALILVKTNSAGAVQNNTLLMLTLLGLLLTPRFQS